MNLDDNVTKCVKLVERDGQLFVFVHKARVTHDYGLPSLQEAIGLHKRENARLRGKARK
jgi:hypothetical protein